MPSSRLFIIAAVLATATSAAQTPMSAALDARQAAASDSSLRIIVSVAHRTLWVVAGTSDTLLIAPVAVGSDRSMRYAGRHWTFSTPRGVLRVASKEENPVWVPPDWHYVEVARQEKLSLVWLHGDTTIALSDGSSLVMHDMRVRLKKGSTYNDFDISEEIVLGNTLFVPPIGSPNRRIPGELGAYRLLLGGGVGIHGTPDEKSVGRAVTHGCMRLHDDDLAWLYEHVPVDTPVYVF